MKLLVSLFGFIIYAYHIFAFENSYRKDEITYLPGLPWQPAFKHYSGYLRSSEYRRLHYWLVESVRAPEHDPLVLWLNGGPGCSSLNGLFDENGPYRTSDDGQTLKYNPYSWNKIANVLYLESPAGVGFSYAKDRKYETNDDQTADDSFRALVDFFDKFPHYRGRKLIITGESYAGVYIPTLMDRFLNDTHHPHINLKGAMIGNGLLEGGEFLVQTNIYYFHSHGLLSDSAYRELQQLCCDDPRQEEDCHYFPAKNIQCASKVIEETLAVMKLPINRYNMYGPCVTADDTEPIRSKKLSQKWINEALTLTFNFLQGQNVTQNLQNLQEISAQESTPAPSFVPCFPGQGTKTYLTRDDVRRAINMLPNFVTGLPEWNGCSTLVDDATGTYTSTYSTQLDVLARLVSSKMYDIVLYYGDQDFVCSFITGRHALHEVAKRAEVEPVQVHLPWYYTSLTNGSQQVGGYTETYEKFMYLLFKGSGHMVPTDKPYQSLDILGRYISGKLFNPNK